MKHIYLAFQVFPEYKNFMFCVLYVLKRRVVTIIIYQFEDSINELLITLNILLNCIEQA